MVYMKAGIGIRPGMVPAMLELLANRIFPILQGKGGWQMCGCFLQRT